VEVLIPNMNGKVGHVDTYMYVLKPGPGNKAFQNKYQDPENANRLTTWAPGLSVIVSLYPCFQHPFDCIPIQQKLNIPYFKSKFALAFLCFFLLLCIITSICFYYVSENLLRAFPIKYFHLMDPCLEFDNRMPLSSCFLFLHSALS
jgi:hypothetical protein